MFCLSGCLVITGCCPQLGGVPREPRTGAWHPAWPRWRRRRSGGLISGNGRSKLTLQTNIHRGIVVRLPEEGRARKHAALCCVNTRAVAEYGWKRVQWKTNLRVCASLDALSQPSIKPKCVYVCGDRFTAKKKRRMSPFLLNHMPTDHKYGVSVLPSFLPRVERGEPKGVVGKDDPHNSSAWFGSKWSFLPS